MTTMTSNSPCAACKFLRRKCQPECVFAPYFPPDQPQKFSNVHKVFGASNVTKLLNELHPHQRDDAVNSLAYEADMRLRDPVYGCVGVISLLQHRLRQLQIDLTCAKSELSKYQSLTTSAGITGHGLIAAATAAAHQHHHPSNNHLHYYQHQFFPTNQQAAVSAAQQMIRSFDVAAAAAAGCGRFGNGCDPGLIAAGIGQLGHQIQKPAAGVAGGDDRRTIVDPSS